MLGVSERERRPARNRDDRRTVVTPADFVFRVPRGVGDRGTRQSLDRTQVDMGSDKFSHGIDCTACAPAVLECGDQPEMA